MIRGMVTDGHGFEPLRFSVFLSAPVEVVTIFFAKKRERMLPRYFLDFRIGGRRCRVRWVCRDFAHLAITLCRCLNIRQDIARVTSAISEFRAIPPQWI